MPPKKSVPLTDINARCVNKRNQAKERMRAYRSRQRNRTEEDEDVADQENTTAGQENTDLEQERSIVRDDHHRANEGRTIARQRRNIPTRGLACNSLRFMELELDPRLNTHSCGNFDAVCIFCNAIRWPNERKSMCCQYGKVQIPLPRPPPPVLVKYYDAGQSGQLFLPQSRAYNNALALASIGCDEKIQPGFNPTFTIQGKLCYRIGSLLPPLGEAPKFAQIFFHDAQTEIQDRLLHVSNLNPDVLAEFQQSLKDVNSYVKSFKSAIEICTDEDVQIVLRADKGMPKDGHARTYNLPASSEVAAICPGNSVGNLDIIIRCREGDGQELRRINTCHRSYDPLHYVLMFPYGCDGWHLGLTKTDNRTLTAADFYCFRLQVRVNDFNIIFKLQKLMQQYAVDQWAKVEASRLEWVRRNQKTIRAEKYQGLLDAVHAGDDVDVGRRIILPPTIYGSPRFYSEAFQDAMSIVRNLGKPDFFITFTCNPKWPEISTALNPGEQACDRPDLSCRVFKIKFDALMDDLLKKEILGGVRAHTVTIEFQKRGLPHAHILLIMDTDSKPKTPDDIDKVVSAEIPDRNLNLMLYKIITSQNVHGPCGPINPHSPCMVDNKCAKGFPKPFQDITSVSETSYPNYRRRSPGRGGRTHEMKVRGNELTVDNSFIVPYNPTLSLRYQAHINMEVVHTVQAVKYLYKYITKGQDRILVGLRDELNNDEVTCYLDARYISSSEAFWRLYGFEIHRKHPAVEKLPCHLPNQQVVTFQPQEVQEVVDRGPPATKLIAFFDMNAEDPRARTILYPDFPHYFTWNNKEHKWQRRKRGTRNPDYPEEYRTDCIGRIPTVTLSPHQAELYYLRMLLYHKSGALSFEDLRSVNGVVCPTFQDACKELGLLEDDTEKDAAIEEASSVQFGPQLRLAFATILIYCRPADPLAFWNRHKLELCRDIMMREKVTSLNHHIENEALLSLQNFLDNEGLELHKDFQLPQPERNRSYDGLPRIVWEEMMFDHDFLCSEVQRGYPQLNDEQRKVFDCVMTSVENKSGNIFALDASGGTGKTHTINLILAAVRSKKKIALATAMSGIAATLLSNGRTLHSRCKVPLCINEHSTCSVSPADATGALLRQSELLVIDEISMGHRYMFEAIDRTLQDIRGSDMPFGGITVLLAGDWRQVLPVVRHGSRPQIVSATLKSSYLWEHVKVLYLTQNMRVMLSGESPEFSEFLLRVGDGTLEVNKSAGDFAIQIPDDIVVPSQEELLEFVFGELNVRYRDSDWISSRAIICPTNTDVDEINNKIMESFPGEGRLYNSSDSIEEDEHQYPIEFINKLCPSGMPPHKLHLKKHSVIMLLRNLDPTNGHCNGTRYIVENLHQHIIDASIASGPHAGKRLFIPRIPLIPSDNIFPFTMKRKQFPVRLSFAITSNKAQGQTLKRVGICLPQPFFSHGQLYVAMSRVGSRDDIRIFAKGEDGPQRKMCTKNVVYPEILHQ